MRTDIQTAAGRFFDLLHDAAEAFVGDVSSPLKRRLRDHKAIEGRVEHAVLARFGLWGPEAHAAVKQADLVALVTEQPGARCR